MKRLSMMVSSALALLVATALAALLNGCETGSADEALSVSPSSAVLSAGETREFTVSGGYDYTWSLANEGVGSLSTRKGNRTRYAAPASVTTNTYQTIKVVSTIEGTSGDSTNGTSYSVTGSAIITFE